MEACIRHWRFELSRPLLARCLRRRPASVGGLVQESACGSGTAAALKGGRAAVALASLYGWATRLIPKHGHYEDETYIKIWLGYARHQWCVRPAQPGRPPL